MGTICPDSRNQLNCHLAQGLLVCTGGLRLAACAMAACAPAQYADVTEMVCLQGGHLREPSVLAQVRVQNDADIANFCVLRYDDRTLLRFLQGHQHHSKAMKQMSKHMRTAINAAAREIKASIHVGARA